MSKPVHLVDIRSLARGLGHMPSKGYLYHQGRHDLIQYVRYNGGFPVIAARLGLPTYNQYHGLHDVRYWTREKIIEQYTSIIRDRQLSTWPTQKELRDWGYGALERAIRVHFESHESLRIATGLNLETKKRPLGHLIPFVRQYDILPEVYEDSETRWYFIGLVASDGYILPDERVIEICLNQSDRPILEDLKARIAPGSNIHIKPHIKESSTAVRWKIYDQQLVDELCRYMPGTNKSYDMTWPEGIPEEYISHFIRGYIDGDGTWGIARGQQVVQKVKKYYYNLSLRILGTRSFLEGMSQTIGLLTGRRPVKVHVKSKRESGGICIIHYSGTSADAIADLLYRDSHLYINRKKVVVDYIRSAPKSRLARNYGTRRGQYNRLAKEGKLFPDH